MRVCHPDFAHWLVSSLRTGLVAIDEHEAIAALSQDAAQLLGCDPSACGAQLGRPAREVLAAQPEVLALLRDASRGRAHPSRAEVTLQAPAGVPGTTLGFTLVTVTDPSLGPRGGAMLFRDLTPFERQGEQERLRDRLAALGQMAAGLAHEIRNPLASMEVLAGLLKRRLGERPEELEWVEELLAEVRTLAGTVSTSLAFVRPSFPNRRPIDPQHLVQQALAAAHSRVPFGGQVEVTCEAGLCPLHADPDQLRAVFTNLIVNALQAMSGCERAGGHRLRVGIESEFEDAGGICVSFSDTGPGVPKELRERIFYPFFTTRDHGTGVGLAEAHKVVASHGGTIALHAAPSGGTTFRIHLPAGPEAP